MPKQMSIFHRGVTFFFKKYLLVTNSITSGLCMAVGDLVQQEFEFQTKVISKRYDWERSGRMFAVGMAMGPMHHYYYVNLDRILPKVNLKTVTLKILSDQLVASPSTLICFFFAMGILEKKSLPEIKSEFEKKILYAYMKPCACLMSVIGMMTTKCFCLSGRLLNNIGHVFLIFYGDCMFWPPVQFVNFYFLPAPYRVVYINFATMLFNIFLSFVKHYDQKH